MKRLIFLFALSWFSYQPVHSQTCIEDVETKDNTRFRFYTAYERPVTNPYLFVDSYYGDGSGPITVRMRLSLISLGPVGDCEICMNNYGFLVHFEMKRSDMAYFKVRPDALEFITADKESHVVDGNLSGAMADTDHWFWQMPDNTGSIEFIFPVEKDENFELYKALATQSAREIRLIDRAMNREFQVGPKDKMALSDALICLAQSLEEHQEGDGSLYGLKEQVDNIQFATTTGMAIMYPTASLQGTGTQVPPETEIQILEWESKNVARVSFENEEGYMAAENIE